MGAVDSTEPERSAEKFLTSAETGKKSGWFFEFGLLDDKFKNFLSEDALIIFANYKAFPSHLEVCTALNEDSLLTPIEEATAG